MPAAHSSSTGAIAFELLAEIAIGESARVDLCRAIGGTHDRRLLAVKRLHPHLAEDPAFENMFLDEVWMTSALRHPNVVEVAGWGVDEQGVYLAVELVPGVSLARLMKTVFDTGEVFSERMVVFIALQIASGLGAAHALLGHDGESLNLVHRDLTPGNVLISFDGDVKIADFGIAKAKQRVTKTATGLVKGKPQYMSPEQARGQDVDGRSDLFALGVVMFELFAGMHPWKASKGLQILHVTQNDPPLDLRACRPKVDKALAAMVAKLIDRDRDARYQRADEVVRELTHWLSVHGYSEANAETLSRFVRRNGMRQMRWFERATSGELAPGFEGGPLRPEPPQPTAYTAVAALDLAAVRSSGFEPTAGRPRQAMLYDDDADTIDIETQERRRAPRAGASARDAMMVEATPPPYDRGDDADFAPTQAIQRRTTESSVASRGSESIPAARGSGASLPTTPPRRAMPANDQELRAEADRLMAEAARCNDEARAANERATQSARIAKAMADAAGIAADAVRRLTSEGPQAALKRFEAAQSLLEAIHRGELAPAEPSGPRRITVDPSRPLSPSEVPPAPSSVSDFSRSLRERPSLVGESPLVFGVRRDVLIVVATGAFMLVVLVLWIALH